VSLHNFSLLCPPCPFLTLALYLSASLYPCLTLSLPCPVPALLRPPCPCLVPSLPHPVPALLRPCLALSMPCSFPAAPSSCHTLSLPHHVPASLSPCITLSLYHSVPASPFLCLPNVIILYLPCLLSPLLSFYFHVLHFFPAFSSSFLRHSCLSYPFLASAYILQKQI
jgi:hypothetical protein